jgi:hypothetical protein
METFQVIQIQAHRSLTFRIGEVRVMLKASLM